MPEKKPFRSVVSQIMVYPILIYIIIIIMVAFFSITSFFSLQRQMISSTVKSLQISLNQVNNVLEQVDYEYVNYWTNSAAHRSLKAYTKDTPKEVYIKHQVEAHTWLRDITIANPEVAGAFSYYENLELFLFQGGGSTLAMQDYVRKEVLEGHNNYNKWEVVEVEGQTYLFCMKKYGGYQGGAWIPAYEMDAYVDPAAFEYMGMVYLVDEKGKAVLHDETAQEAIWEQGWQEEWLKVNGKVYYNYTIGEDGGLHMGMLVSQREFISNIIKLNWGILVLALLSVAAAPFCIFWLRSKIARPVREIDEALSRVGTGDGEYYMQVRQEPYETEFDHLVDRFNETLHRLQEAEDLAHESELKEQHTKLMYVSQQIRPHFILNALNIIYTCEEHEFPLVKKLVLYLTQYFRYIVNLNQDFVEVSKEMRHIQNYLNIQKERYGDRFEAFVEYELEVEDVMVPPLIIQTFAENCIKYGMRNEDKTYIYVLASRDRDRLHLMIADTGNGFSETKLEQLNHFIKTREGGELIGVGIKNAVERMDILYHGEVEIRLRNALSGGAVVDIYLPMVEINEGKYNV